MNTINEISQRAHEHAKKFGFYDTPRNTGETLCLIHSEVSEALECDRKGKYALAGNVDMVEQYQGDFFRASFESSVKDTFQDELADIMIRVMDLAASKSIDLEKHILLKMRYNSMREYKHGKNY